MRTCAVILLTVAVIRLIPAVSAQDYRPPLAEASRDAELAIQGFRVPAGMTASVAAAEPLVANPVAFAISDDGRLFVCETFRQEKGVEDNRSHMNWLENDLRLQTVEERLAMFRNVLGVEVEQYGIEHDRVRMLADVDGDGVYETATVYADGFNDVLTGTGAGVLEHRGEVFYTCIPDLWKLVDTDGDGTADVRDPLHHGYGVRVAFRGHDLHGLTIGPDGRLYFSIGDRGFNVITKEQSRIKRVDTGAVFRCDLDGTNLEVFAYGLRNPQELAFDNEGFLFTGDNNSDGGDQARWVYVVQDGDTGWRMYYQYLDDRGPWNRERMWYPDRADEQTAAVQPAFIVPPIANLGDGPSGLTYYPGTGLPERYAGHFFMADFRGTSFNSGIRSFTVTPQGATWKLADSHEFLWSILATDVDFAPDGSILVSDWVNGWIGENKGRVYRFRTDAPEKQQAGVAVAKLLGGGVAAAEISELRALLTHADRRVRQAAQFELVRRDAEPELIEDLAHAADPLHRRHAVFGCWQLGLQSPQRAETMMAALESLLTDDTAISTDLQTLAIRVVSDLVQRHGLAHWSLKRRRQLAGVFSTLTQHNDLRLAGFATVALGRIGFAEHAAPIVQAFSDDESQDPVVRHQVAMGITQLADRNPGLLNRLAASAQPSEKMPILLAMRRLHDPGMVTFLSDSDGRLVDEAARAIHDEPIPGTLEALADLALRPGLSDATLTRAINACYRIGTADHASAVATIAASRSVSDSTRLLAARMLTSWNTPGNLDLVTGRWWPLSHRDVDGLREAVGPHLPAMLGAGARVRDEAIAAAASLGIVDVEPHLQQILADTSAGDETRAAAFQALGRLTGNPDALVASGLNSDIEAVRVAAVTLLAQRRPAAAVPELETLLSGGTVPAQQQAVELLADVGTPPATQLLVETFRQLNQGEVVSGIALELLAAAKSLNHPELTDAAAQYRRQQQEEGTPTAMFSECLEGGDVASGYQVFFGRSAASCRRCHKVNGDGSEVGPDLSAIAKDKDRRYLLEAIVDPNAKIAKGFETLIVVTIEGKVLSGIVKSEDEEFVRLMTPEGSLLTVAQDDIEDRAKGQSGMPNDLSKNLTRQEIRDLVAYLATLKTATDASHGEGSEGGER